MLTILDIIELRRYGYEKRDSILKSKLNLSDRDFEFIKKDVRLRSTEINRLLMDNLFYLKPDSGLFYENKLEILVRYFKEVKKLLVNRYEFLTEESCIYYLVDEGYGIERRFRDTFYKSGMYSLLTVEYLDELSLHLRGKKVLELCGGRGYLSKGLSDRGVNIKCTDDKSWHSRENWGRNYIETENLDALKALDKYVEEVDIVLVSWIPYNSNLDNEILKRIRESNRKPKLLIIGEPIGGCTGSEAFHYNRIEVNKEISIKINEKKANWDSIHDMVMICI